MKKVLTLALIWSVTAGTLKLPYTIAQTQQRTILLQQQGSLDSGDRTLQNDGSRIDEYSFQGTQGQSVTLTLQSSSFDTYLILLDANGNKIAENDDVSSENLNSQIQVTLPYTGTYQVFANSLDASGQGAYLLTVDVPGNASAAQAPGNPSIPPQATAPTTIPSYTRTGLNPQEISQIAQEITVLIKSQYSGSGVIIAKNGSTYYVLTAAHVVKYPDLSYTIVTPDQQEYTLDYQTVRKIPDVDLAILEFRSDRTYSTARLANSDQATIGAETNVFGFPALSASIQEVTFRFAGKGTVSARLQNQAEGYNLVYNNNTDSGMSGGPVLDAMGRLIGIHGQAETQDQPAAQSGADSDPRTGVNRGIPINTFISLAEKVNFNLSAMQVRVDNTPITSGLPAQVPAGAIPARPGQIYTPATPARPVCPGRRC
jgi:serine protease Do